MNSDNDGSRQQTSSWRDWHVPLSCEDMSLQQILDSADQFAADPDDIPLVIQLIENPKFDIPGITLFNGAVDLHSHDCIHALLGRGLLPKDEAFVIGFTMGSSNRVSSTEERLYTFAARYLYPGPYQFKDDEIQVFKDAVRLGYISDCVNLAEIDYTDYLDWKIADLRKKFNIETDLLEAYYRIEVKRYPQDAASSRLFA